MLKTCSYIPFLAKTLVSILKQNGKYPIQYSPSFGGSLQVKADFA